LAIAINFLLISTNVRDETAGCMISYRNTYYDKQCKFDFRNYSYTYNLLVYSIMNAQDYQIAGTPLEPLLLPKCRKILGTRVNNPENSKNAKDWAIRSQVLNNVLKTRCMDAVHRLNGNRLIDMIRLRYSQPVYESIWTAMLDRIKYLTVRTVQQFFV
jgi:hypothetical protein